MPEKHVVFALMERRARLAGEQRAKQAEVLSLKRALESNGTLDDTTRAHLEECQERIGRSYRPNAQGCRAQPSPTRQVGRRLSKDRFLGLHPA